MLKWFLYMCLSILLTSCTVQFHASPKVSMIPGQLKQNAGWWGKVFQSAIIKPNDPFSDAAKEALWTNETVFSGIPAILQNFIYLTVSTGITTFKMKN